MFWQKRDEKFAMKEPDVFNGIVFEYPGWINCIVTQVENRYIEDTDRLYYLGKYAAGEARMNIKCLLALNTDHAYTMAKKV